MKRVRGFEVVSKYQQNFDDDKYQVTLPKRSTLNAAGYDLQSASNIVIPAGYAPVLVPTGIKAYMQENEVLLMYNRSSNPIKRHLIMSNGVGVIDADYYNNESNEGELFVQLQNQGPDDYYVNQGDRIAQVVFTPFLLSDGDLKDGKKRVGGFGSTGD